jgi:hypothetical protein
VAALDNLVLPVPVEVRQSGRGEFGVGVQEGKAGQVRTTAGINGVGVLAHAPRHDGCLALK